jgi:hypothetical protein
MGPEEKSDVPEVSGPWLHISHEPPYNPNHRVVEVLVYISVGLNVGIAFTNLAVVRYGVHRANVGGFVAIAVIALLQVVFFVVNTRRLRRLHEQLKRDAKRFAFTSEGETSPEAQDSPRTVQ